MSGALFIATLVYLGGVDSRGGVVLNEIHYHPPAGEEKSLEFVELFNSGPALVDIGGWRLAGAVAFTFPAGSMLPGGGYAIVCRDLELFQGFFSISGPGVFGNFSGSLDNAGEEVLLVDAFNARIDSVFYDDEAPWPVAADGPGASLERVCDAAPSWDARNWSAADPPTPLAPNSSVRCPLPEYQAPPVVISEIHYHPVRPEEVHVAGDDGEALEFIELHNPKNEPVNLRGWKFSAGAGFAFASDRDTLIPPAGYLVVCRDEATVRAKFPSVSTVGSFTGKLSNSGERITLVDSMDSVVDSVRYAETGDWPYAADGEGRSLEKIVLTAAGDDPANWSASKLGSPDFQQLANDGSLGGQPTQRMILFIDGEGECIVDNVVVEDLSQPGVNLVNNGAFDIDPFDPTLGGWKKDNAPQVAQSAWSPGEGVNGTGALRLVSSGSCPNGCSTLNSVSQVLPIPNDPEHRAATYRVSMDVKYVRGSTTFRGGLLRGVGAGFNVFTPGMPNTVASQKAPPFITHVRRFPEEPKSTDSTWITAEVRPGVVAPGAPAGGRLDVLLVHSGGSSQFPAFPLPMFDDGVHRDGRPGDAVFGVELPPLAHDSQLRYRILAREAGGVEAEFPRPVVPGAPLPLDVWGYYVNDLQVDSALPVYQILLDGVDGSDWMAVNAYLGPCDPLKLASFAFEGDLYPEVGVRFRGNTACVIDKRNFKVVFNHGRYFRGVHKMNLNGIWTDKALVREHLSWKFLQEIGIAYSETEYIRLQVSGSYYGLFLYLEHPDKRFLERNDLDPDGNLYKARQPPRDPGVLPIGVSQKDRAANEYQSYWEEETNDGGDFADLADFIDAMHTQGRPPGEQSLSFWQERSFEEIIIGYQVGQVVLNNIDSFAKNHFLYHDLRPGADRWAFLTWDLDLTFGKFFTFCAVNAQAGRQVGTLNDIVLCDTPLSQQEECARRNLPLPPQLDPWFATTVVQPQVLNWLVDFFFRTGDGNYQRAYLTYLWDVLEEKFVNSAYDPQLDELAAFLAEEEQEDFRRWGRYPSNVAGYPQDMLRNIAIMKQQIKCHRDFLRRNIQNCCPDIPVHPRVKITEIMYQPELGNQDLEFVEILNTSGRDIDISLWGITEGIEFVFPPKSTVRAGEVFIVAKDPQRFRSRYRSVAARVFGPYEGKLADEGDRLRVIDAGAGDYPATIDFVGYESDGDWPELLPGQSLELAEPRPNSDNDRGVYWRASTARGGTPGTVSVSFRRGDANDNAQVNLTDAVFVLNYLFLSGPKPGCLDAADTNDDGMINLTDGVYLLTHLFLAGPAPPAPYPGEGIDPTADTLSCLESLHRVG